MKLNEAKTSSIANRLQKHIYSIADINMKIKKENTDAWRLIQQAMSKMNLAIKELEK